jgi:hypothetical protein
MSIMTSELPTQFVSAHSRIAENQPVGITPGDPHGRKIHAMLG